MTHATENSRIFPSVEMEFTIRVRVNPDAYLAEYGDYGRIEDDGAIVYAREVLSDYFVLPEHLRPILNAELDPAPRIPRTVRPDRKGQLT